MVTLFGPLPLNVGVLSLVTLSVLEAPSSDASSRSGVPGVLGTMMSMVIASAPESAEGLPAVSVERAVIECGPLDSVEAVIVQLPVVMSAVVLPIWLAP